ncbi:hypothetical protein ACFQ10_09955 [Streptomyces indonesiensis]
MIRSTTATVTTLFGAMLIVQAFAPALPGAFGDRVAKYWPPIAGGQIITGHRDPALPPLVGARRHGRVCRGPADRGVHRLPPTRRVTGREAGVRTIGRGRDG